MICLGNDTENAGCGVGKSVNDDIMTVFIVLEGQSIIIMMGSWWLK